MSLSLKSMGFCSVHYVFPALKKKLPQKGPKEILEESYR
jgi:hypothetical protein